MTERVSPIVKILDDQIAFLCDPTTKWRRGYPRSATEACAVYRGLGMSIISGLESPQDRRWVHETAQFCTSAEWQHNEIGKGLVVFNDYIARDVWDVVWLLEDIRDLAIEEGV